MKTEVKELSVIDDEPANIIAPDRLNTLTNYYPEPVIERHMQNLFATYGVDRVMRCVEQYHAVIVFGQKVS